MHARSSWLVRVGLWITLAPLGGLVACSISQDQEIEIGKRNASEVESEVPVVHDSVVDRFITELGQSMASRTSRADLEWHFTLVNSPEVNAFAIPGGFVYINRGAIEQADRLDELAGIMGHEIGHVVQRHSVKQMEKARRGEVGLLLLCTLTRACSTVGGRVAVDIGANAMSAHYSQHDEAQADSEGVVNTLRVRIDPEGLPSFFEKLLETQKEHPDAVQAFFSTHPTDQSRVAATRHQIAELGPVTGKNLVRDTPEFHDIQARVRALPAPPPPRAADHK